MEKLFIFATSVINYTRDGQAMKLFKLLCKDVKGKEHEVLTSAEPTGPVALCTFVKKGQTLYTRKTGEKVVADNDQFKLEYYTSIEQVTAAKAAYAAINEMNWE